VWARRRAAFEELQTGLPVCDAWLEIAGGQMWSLLTTNQQGIATRTELRPTMVDGDYVVGFTWTRERAARVTKKFHNGIWVPSRLRIQKLRIRRLLCLPTSWG
jgi:hypothetical protein